MTEKLWRNEWKRKRVDVATLLCALANDVLLNARTQHQTAKLLRERTVSCTARAKETEMRRRSSLLAATSR